MNTDIEKNIRLNVPWSKLPNNIKLNLANAQREYDKYVVAYSIRNQLRYKGNLIRQIRKDERRYYEDLIKYSRDHLMLYPYHLSDVIVKGLRMTPFAYYTNVVSDLMTHEKSYDSLPNFTAADCLRLMGIGRNQYIDIMNICRSKKLFRKRPIKESLPKQPIESVVVDSWWIVNTGYIAEEDIRLCMTEEKAVIDLIIDKGAQLSCKLDFNIIQNLYRKGLIYFDVPINDEDFIIVPPLEGFVMNRVLGDYFETLLYKIFVSIDERTNVAELAKILEIDIQLVKNAVSLFCRLGFGRKKFLEINQNNQHISWHNLEQNNTAVKKPNPDQLLIHWTSMLNNNQQADSINNETTNQINSADGSINCDNDSSSSSGNGSSSFSKRIGLLFDSTLTAFLMMGNLSPGLKSHAVTMFEVGKLNDETLDSFLMELEKIDPFAEGEAQRYFEHAIALRDTILFLRKKKKVPTATLR